MPYGLQFVLNMKLGRLSASGQSRKRIELFYWSELSYYSILQQYSSSIKALDKLGSVEGLPFNNFLFISRHLSFPGTKIFTVCISCWFSDICSPGGWRQISRNKVKSALGYCVKFFFYSIYVCVTWKFWNIQ